MLNVMCWLRNELWSLKVCGIPVFRAGSRKVVQQSCLTHGTHGLATIYCDRWNIGILFPPGDHAETRQHPIDTRH